MSSPSTPLIDVEIVEQDTPYLVEEFFEVRNIQLHEVAIQQLHRTVSLDTGSELLRNSQCRPSWKGTTSLATCDEEAAAGAEQANGKYDCRAESVPVGRRVTNRVASSGSSSFVDRRPDAQSLHLVIPSAEFLQQHSPRLRGVSQSPDGNVSRANSSRSSWLGSPTTPCGAIAERLASMGDQIQQGELRTFLKLLTRQASVTYGTFCEAAEKVVPLPSTIRWTSVAAFLFFGHWVALELGKVTESLYSKVLQWTVQYVCERFSSWIAEQGGWANCLGPVGAVSFHPSEVLEHMAQPALVGIVGVIALVSLAVIVSLVRGQAQP